MSPAKVCREGGGCSCWYQSLWRNSPPQAQTITPPARVIDRQHSLLGQTRYKIQHTKRLFFNIFNESFATLLSRHRISVRTGEQFFYMYVKLYCFPKDGSCSHPSQQEPQMLRQRIQSCGLSKRRYKSLCIFLSLTLGICFCRCLYHHTVYNW